MKSVRHRWLMRAGAVTVAAATVLGIAGCSAESDTSDSKPKVSETATAEPSESAAPVADYGDVIPSDKVLSNEHGSFTQMKLDPNSDALTWDASKVTAAGLGSFSEADATSAQKWVAEFVASDSTDSYALNGTAEDAARWFEENKATLIDPDNLALFEAPPTDNAENASDRHSIINTDNRSNVPVLIYDGGPRVANNEIDFNSFEHYLNGEDYLKINGSAITKYRTTDEASAAKFTEKYGPGETDAYPGFTDGKDGTVNFLWNFTYFVIPDGDSWRLASYDNELFATDPPID
jgi:hypothetical protein